MCLLSLFICVHIGLLLFGCLVSRPLSAIIHLLVHYFCLFKNYLVAMSGSHIFHRFVLLLFKEIVVGDNMDKIYIVMEYVEHDLKTLMESMKQPFLVGETFDILCDVFVRFCWC